MRTQCSCGKYNGWEGTIATEGKHVCSHCGNVRIAVVNGSKVGKRDRS